MTEDQDAPRLSAHALRSVGESRPSPAHKFLIANLELESSSNHRKQSPLTFSSRKFLAIFHSENRFSPPVVAHLTHRWPRTSIVRLSRGRFVGRDDSECKTRQ